MLYKISHLSKTRNISPRLKSWVDIKKHKSATKTTLKAHFFQKNFLLDTIDKIYYLNMSRKSHWEIPLQKMWIYGIII